MDGWMDDDINECVHGTVFHLWHNSKFQYNTEWKVGHDGFDTEFEITFRWIGVESVWQQFKKKNASATDKYPYRMSMHSEWKKKIGLWTNWMCSCKPINVVHSNRQTHKRTHSHPNRYINCNLRVKWTIQRKVKCDKRGKEDLMDGKKRCGI